MNKPVLVIMAAGMGSRYGGLKQIDPVGSHGEIILDFSLYDAMLAGFDRAIFIIKRENEEAFREILDGRAGKHMQIDYAFQDIDDIPEGFTVPEGRVKPWGTCHAVMAARDLIDGPFAVINADDYYGPSAFSAIYEFLEKGAENAPAPYEFCMVGYELAKTLTENGHVSRGVCEVTDDGYLESVVEHTKLMWQEGSVVDAACEGGFVPVPSDATVSMNFWGFTKDMLREMQAGFPEFLNKALSENPEKAEYFLPAVVSKLIDEGKARVRVLKSPDKWYGVTYKEDKEGVEDALQAMKDKGLYPDHLWK